MEVRNLFIKDETYDDGKIQVGVKAYDGIIHFAYINKDEAKKIVDHLTKVFELDV